MEAKEKNALLATVKIATEVATEGQRQRTYPGQIKKVQNDHRLFPGVHLRSLKEKVTKTGCDKADAQKSKRRKINCDIFHLFVNASLAGRSLKTTVASYGIEEVTAK